MYHSVKLWKINFLLWMYSNLMLSPGSYKGSVLISPWKAMRSVAVFTSGWILWGLIILSIFQVSFPNEWAFIETEPAPAEKCKSDNGVEWNQRETPFSIHDFLHSNFCRGPFGCYYVLFLIVKTDAIIANVVFGLLAFMRHFSLHFNSLSHCLLGQRNSKEVRPPKIFLTCFPTSV